MVFDNMPQTKNHIIGDYAREHRVAEMKKTLAYVGEAFRFFMESANGAMGSSRLLRN